MPHTRSFSYQVLLVENSEILTWAVSSPTNSSIANTQQHNRRATLAAHLYFADITDLSRPLTVNSPWFSEVDILLLVMSLGDFVHCRNKTKTAEEAGHGGERREEREKSRQARTQARKQCPCSAILAHQTCPL